MTAPDGPERRGAQGTARRAARKVDLDRLGRLEEERDFLLRSLEDLEAEHEAGDLDAPDYEALRDDYTARAAAVLRAIDEDRATIAAAPRASRGRALAWIVGVVAFGVVAGLLLAQASGTRTDGETATGDIRQSTRNLLLEAQRRFVDGDVEGAVAAYDEVLAMAPTDVEALTYKAWVGRNGGVLDDQAALVLLDEAVAVDGDYVDARIFRAVVLTAGGRSAEAAADLFVVGVDGVPAGMGPMVASLAVDVADARLADGDAAMANEVLDLALALAPDDVRALVARGLLLGRAASAADGEDRSLLIERSIDAFDRAAAVDPEEPFVLLARATVLAELGRVGEAEAALDDLDALDPAPDVAAEADRLRDRLDG